jgi:hypothetical protein
MEAAAVSSDGLIDLLYKLKAKYRKNAVWVMNSNTAATLQKLKNGNGDYIWRDRLVAGSPDTLLGRPVQYLKPCLMRMPEKRSSRLATSSAVISSWITPLACVPALTTSPSRVLQGAHR